MTHTKKKMDATLGAKTALLPHMFLCIAYEIAQRLFPKNIGIL
jgi:hypothetical protein